MLTATVLMLVNMMLVQLTEHRALQSTHTHTHSESRLNLTVNSENISVSRYHANVSEGSSSSAPVSVHPSILVHRTQDGRGRKRSFTV